MIGLFLILTSKSHYAAENDFYPIIFIHGHGGGEISIEDTWASLIEQNMVPNSAGYTFYDPNHDGKIDVLHSDSSKNLKTNSLSPRTIFSFGYYRASADKPFGDVSGYIGCCPEPYTGDYGNWYYVDKYNNPKVSFAVRLGQVIDNVLRATGKDKVNLVCHSMGGLVARAYIKWVPDGAKKVNKLLTVGTPNNGIPDDLRLKLEKFFKVQDWQKSGEEEEMASGQKRFNGKNYTEVLNENWKEFCKKNDVKYATLRGNFNPWQIIQIGDGVVEEDSAQLQGAVFNGVAYMAHMNSENFTLNRMIVDIASGFFPNPMCMTESTYVSEVIKRWMMQDQKNEGAVVDKVAIANPFDSKITLQYRINSGSAISADILVYDMLGNVVASLQTPVYPLQHLVTFDIAQLGLSNGVYTCYLNIYDVNGSLYAQTFRLAKIAGYGDYPGGPTIRFLTTAPSETTSTTASFKYTYDNNGGSYSYSLDGAPMSDHTTLDNVSFSNLTPGKHVFMVSGYGYPAYRANNAAVFTWIVNEKNKKISQDIVTQGRLVEAENSLKTSGNVTIKEGASVKMKAPTVRLLPGFKAKSGSEAVIKAGGNP